MSPRRPSCALALALSVAFGAGIASAQPAAPDAGASASTMPPPGVDWGSTVWRKTGPPGYFFSGFNSETEYDDPIANVQPPNPPPLTSAYKARWDKLRQEAFAGANTFNISSDCSLFGMPSVIALSSFELLFTPGRATMIYGGQGGLRRIFMDGRAHPAEILELQYNGDSIGHWEGKTLVIDTVGLRTDTIIEPGLPHSDKLRVVERWTEVKPGVLEDEVTMTDPEVLTRPWKKVWTFGRVARDQEQYEFLDFTCENNRSHMVDGKVVMIGPDGKPLTGGK